MAVSHTCHSLSWLSVAAAFVLFANTAHAGLIYDEAIDGDLSGDRFAPSVLEFGMDANVVRGSVGPAAEDDIFTFTLSEGMYLSAVVLVEYSSSANTSFLGVQPGEVYLSGFDHWGYVAFGQGDIGSDVLASMARSRGLFEVPLGPGSYTWWIDEYTHLESYALRFDIVPEPASALMVLLGCAVLLGPARRRRPRRQ